VSGLGWRAEIAIEEGISDCFGRLK
jgi:hypothetical protein